MEEYNVKIDHLTSLRDSLLLELQKFDEKLSEIQTTIWKKEAELTVQRNAVKKIADPHMAISRITKLSNEIDEMKLRLQELKNKKFPYEKSMIDMYNEEINKLSSR